MIRYHSAAAPTLFRGQRSNSYKINARIWRALIMEACGDVSDVMFVSCLLIGICDHFFLLSGAEYRFFGAAVSDRVKATYFLHLGLLGKTVHMFWIVHKQRDREISVIDFSLDQDAEPQLSDTSNCKAPSTVAASTARRSAIVNHLRRLQNARKISPLFLFSVGYLCMMPVDVCKEADLKPNDFFTTSTVILVLVGFAYHAVSGVYERIIGKGNPAQDLVNLCTWLNCGVLIRPYKLFAYYISDRPLLTADVDGLILKKAGLTTREEPQRHKTVQTFTIALPDQFEVLHRQISTKNDELTKCRPCSITESRPGAPDQPSPLVIPDVSGIHYFLQRFLRGKLNTIGYVTRGRVYVGSDAKTPHIEGHQCEDCKGVMIGGRKHWRAATCSWVKADRLKSPEKWQKEPHFTDDQIGVMYYDPDMNFTKDFFFGRTFDLFVFEALLFTCVTLNTNSCTLASVIVLLTGWFLSTLRVIWGNRSLDKSIV